MEQQLVKTPRFLNYGMHQRDFKIKQRKEIKISVFKEILSVNLLNLRVV